MKATDSNVQSEYKKPTEKREEDDIKTEWKSRMEKGFQENKTKMEEFQAQMEKEKAENAKKIEEILTLVKSGKEENRMRIEDKDVEQGKKVDRTNIEQLQCQVEKEKEKIRRMIEVTSDLTLQLNKNEEENKILKMEKEELEQRIITLDNEQHKEQEERRRLKKMNNARGMEWMNEKISEIDVLKKEKDAEIQKRNVAENELRELKILFNQNIMDFIKTSEEAARLVKTVNVLNEKIVNLEEVKIAFKHVNDNLAKVIKEQQHELTTYKQELKKETEKDMNGIKNKHHKNEACCSRR